MRWFLLAFCLAGCLHPESSTQTHAPDPDTVAGVVLGPDFFPIPGATVSLHGGGNATTGEGGRFAIAAPPGTHLTEIRSPAHDMLQVSLATGVLHKIILEPAPSGVSYAQPFHFRGHIECALEALIVSPGCDSAATAILGTDPLFSTNQSFDFAVGEGWQTVVLDVDFDGGHPGLAGLRLVLDAGREKASSGYQQYGRWSAAASQSIHVVPNGTYPDGAGPVPPTIRFFAANVFPHSHGHHAVLPVLGAGVGVDVEFDLFVTAFHGTPAPTGWSRL